MREYRFAVVEWPLLVLDIVEEKIFWTSMKCTIALWGV
ncbi:hypothetical protein TRICHSKD4_1116 [Roseibium sp. TrichSKD4]|nr:hypothetical protein TRICHSKD4_6297 [Roseibium sp. TrichSKD4]EFO31302.1 hypothetical protein TRICHSKD4_3534 [Roseibium sp. TrichSKD4]EFO32115.1 hypothetical protein TRICHSKD4_2706 [Roseibium sp. TrichSKD4]EFO32148.1 hypothetical protein TRICHSKD4_1944 [Roseibium sp. TrichSKD4]EFO33309.1 hypothetical protein TRICHSKD4_1939 [Roseibium sp. TrichSKD4]